MHFVQCFGSGYNPTVSTTDPRNKIWAEYHCSICGEDSEIDITRNKDTFDFARERKCKQCGMINSDDREINLKTQLDRLTMDKSRIDVQIEMIERELNELQTKGVVDNESQIKSNNK